ncbi:hypothetical protein [Natronobiforma cellulositropha]|nr:hypothetical protein [Natronobiforma cellulositropha]
MHPRRSSERQSHAVLESDERRYASETADRTRTYGPRYAHTAQRRTTGYP